MKDSLLKDKNLYPNDDVIKYILENSYFAFEKLKNILFDKGINFEWNYYNDGHIWLCKLMLKKKNLGWIRIFDTYFKIIFYFTEKHLESINALDIAKVHKENFYKVKPSGKLLPMVIDIANEDELKDVITVFDFKKGLKS